MMANCNKQDKNIQVTHYKNLNQKPIPVLTKPHKRLPHINLAKDHTLKTMGSSRLVMKYRYNNNNQFNNSILNKSRMNLLIHSLRLLYQICKSSSNHYKTKIRMNYITSR